MPVRLHVYDLTPANGVLHPVGLGLYHSGVEVDGEEYTFAQGGGIISHPPKAAESEQGHLAFRETLEIGVFEGSSHVVKDAVAALRPHFRGDHYHLIKQNCNHFSDRFCMQLFPSRPNGIPAYINRVAWIGSFMPCLLPNDEDGQQAHAKKREDNGRVSGIRDAFPGHGQTTGSGNERGSVQKKGNEEEVRNRMTEVRRARLKYLNNLQQQHESTVAAATTKDNSVVSS